MGCTSRSVRMTVLAASMWLVPAVPVLAQHDMPMAAPAATSGAKADPLTLPKYVADPIPLYTVGLGPFTRKISSSNSEAQAFFDQGFQMM